MDNFSELPPFASMILRGGEHLTPWLAARVTGAALCATVEDEARSREISTLYLFTLDKQAWYSRLGWTVLDPCVWHERPGEIMCKHLQIV